MSTSNELYAESEQLKVDGKLDEAIAKLLELLEQEDTYAIAHSALAVLYGRVDRHDEAVKHGQRVCELEPNDAFSFTAMSVTYQRAYAGTNDTQYIQAAEDAMARSHSLQSGGPRP